MLGDKLNIHKEKEDMKHYELLIVVKPTLSPEEAIAKRDAIKSLLEKNGASIKRVEEMGVRKLAYEIDKHERGNYFVYYYEGVPASMDEILRNLRIDEELLRFLNVKYESKKEISFWEKLSSGKKTETNKEKKEESQEEAKEEN